MRIKALLIGDMRFQLKYGFYFIYVILSIFYIALIFAFPASWRAKAAVLMIFSDPAAMGLFFMGAIVLFEKSERVLDSIAVSPTKPSEYVLSKLISIGIISAVAALAIGLPAKVITSPLPFIIGVFLCSCLFSSVGLIIACRVSTLNRFIIATIPAELIINTPAIAWLFGYNRPLLRLHPGISMIELCTVNENALFPILILLLWTVLLGFIARDSVRGMLKSLGGVKL